MTSGPNTLASPNAQPLSFAVSPYLGLSFRRAPAQTVSRRASAELLCVDPVTSQLRPTASRFFEGEGEAGDDAAITARATSWARELHRLLAPESPLALLRLREIHVLPEGGKLEADTAAVVTRFRFALVRGLELRAALGRPVARLRAAPADLRFREGQYGGYHLPDPIQPFELAPPQVVGAQPIYLTERPAPPAAPQPEGAAPPRAVRWPWGLSALRFSVLYTQAGRGIAGPQTRTGSVAPACGGRRSSTASSSDRVCARADRPPACRRCSAGRPSAACCRSCPRRRCRPGVRWSGCSRARADRTLR